MSAPTGWTTTRVVVLAHDGARDAALADLNVAGIVATPVTDPAMPDAPQLAVYDVVNRDPHGAASAARAIEQAGLTERQVQILRLIAEGCTNIEVGATLDLPPRTVKTSVATMFRRLQTTDRANAVLIAYRLGILDVHGVTS